MLSVKRKPANRPAQEERTADRILSAATQLFAAQGFEGTTTKEICEAAKVNIAAIHYHFGSKDNLYRKIIERFSGSRLELAERTLIEPRDHSEMRIRLEMFVSESVESFISQPELYRIVQTEIELLHARSEKVFRNTLLKACDKLTCFLAAAKKRGLIRQDLDPLIAARSLFSQLSHQTRSDRVNKRYFGISLSDPKYKKIWIDQTLDIFLHGVGRS